jgi:hypothetical protein
MVFKWEGERKILQSWQLALDVYWPLSEGIKAFYSVLGMALPIRGGAKEGEKVLGVGGAWAEEIEKCG